MVGSRVSKEGMEDYLKRGREEEDVDRVEEIEEEGLEWAFSKSRKVGRSPPLENRRGGIEELLSRIREEMNKGLVEVSKRGEEILGKGGRDLE